MTERDEAFTWMAPVAVERELREAFAAEGVEYPDKPKPKPRRLTYLDETAESAHCADELVRALASSRYGGAWAGPWRDPSRPLSLIITREEDGHEAELAFDVFARYSVSPVESLKWPEVPELKPKRSL